MIFVRADYMLYTLTFYRIFIKYPHNGLRTPLA